MRRRPSPRTLEVLRKEILTPHMLRVTLGGPGLEGFPDDSDGDYIKLSLAEPGEPDKAAVRTYTVRHYNAKAGELDVDFVIHESDGPAANWAQNCNRGDQIVIGGPGPKKLLDFSADWFLLIGDMSALPAISANIERMPRDAKGYALLEIIHQGDKQQLDVPQNLQVDWIVNSKPEEPNEILFDAVKALSWQDGRVSVWVAGELSQSLAIRNFLKTDRRVTPNQMYASSYWQIGQTEDGHRISKRRVQS